MMWCWGFDISATEKSNQMLGKGQLCMWNTNKSFRPEDVNQVNSIFNLSVSKLRIFHCFASLQTALTDFRVCYKCSTTTIWALNEFTLRRIYYSRGLYLGRLSTLNSANVYLTPWCTWRCYWLCVWYGPSAYLLLVDSFHSRLEEVNDD